MDATRPAAGRLIASGEPLQQHPANSWKQVAPQITELLALLRDECNPGSAAHGRLRLPRSGLHNEDAVHQGDSRSSRLPLVAVALLQLCKPSQQQPANPGTAVRLAGSRFVPAYQAELQRLQGIISSVFEVLLHQVAALGQQLPPLPKKQANSDGATTASTPTASAADGAAAESDRHLAWLQAQCDVIAAEVAALDDVIRSSFSVMARFGQLYDMQMAAAAGEKLEPLQVPTFSHSSAAGCAAHQSGVPPDVYHQCVYRYLAGPAPLDPLLWGLSTACARLQELERRTAAAAAAATAQAAASPAGRQQQARERDRSSAAAAAAKDNPGEAAAAAGPASSPGDEQWHAPDQFERSTSKYWVHPAHLSRVKLALGRHLPLLVYGAKDPVHNSSIASPEELRAAGQKVKGLVNSVYFDDAQLSMYHERLKREHGARLLRLRCYGPRAPGAQQQQIFVERKTHKEKWTGERSVKERVCLEQGQVPGYLSGRVSAADLGSNKEVLLTEVQQLLLERNMGPAVRTEYHRTAWQQYNSNKIRVSLDEHMLMVRESPDQVTPGDWAGRQGLDAPLAADEVVRFPYGVLEIKVQEEPPAWLQELTSSGVLVKLPRFSKFLHGMALLHPAGTVTNPSWFLEEPSNPGLFTPATIEEVADDTDKYSGEASSWYFPGAAAPAAKGTGGLFGAFKSAFSRSTAGLQPAAPAAADRAAAAAAAAADPLAQYLPASSAVVPHHGPVTDQWWRNILSTAHSTASSCCTSTGGAGSNCGSSGSTWTSSGGASSPVKARGQQWAELSGAVFKSDSASTLDRHPGSPTRGPAAVLAGVCHQPANSYSRSSGTPPSPCSPIAAAAADRDGSSCRDRTPAAAGLNGPSLRNGAPGPVGIGNAGKGAADAITVELSSMLAFSTAAAGAGAVKDPLLSPHLLPSALVLGNVSAAADKKAAGAAALDSSNSSNGRGAGSKWRRKVASLTSKLHRKRGDDQQLLPVASSPSSGPSGSTNRSQSLVRTLIEPKTFFANERTFLAWLHIGVLVLMTGLGLLTGSKVAPQGKHGGSCSTDPLCQALRVSGACISPIALMIIGYALYVYKKRSIQILRRETVRYDDQRGPVVLVVLLIVVGMLCVGLSLAGVWADLNR